jgi:hypothetical protein
MIVCRGGGEIRNGDLSFEYRSDTKNTGTMPRLWPIRSIRTDVRDAVNFTLKKMIEERTVHFIKPNGYITYHQLSNSNLLHSAHTLYVFCADLREKYSDYFPIQH